MINDSILQCAHRTPTKNIFLEDWNEMQSIQRRTANRRSNHLIVFVTSPYWTSEALLSVNWRNKNNLVSHSTEHSDKKGQVSHSKLPLLI